jgi:hypothetical protein
MNDGHDATGRKYRYNLEGSQSELAQKINTLLSSTAISQNLHIHMATIKARTNEVAAAVPTTRTLESASELAVLPPGDTGSQASPFGGT